MSEQRIARIEELRQKRDRLRHQKEVEHARLAIQELLSATPSIQWLGFESSAVLNFVLGTIVREVSPYERSPDARCWIHQKPHLRAWLRCLGAQHWMGDECYVWFHSFWALPLSRIRILNRDEWLTDLWDAQQSQNVYEFSVFLSANSHSWLVLRRDEDNHDAFWGSLPNLTA